jgi:hypothetical protein
MAIDGSKIGKPPVKKDGYESPAVRVAAWAIFWVPVGLIVAFAYWSGTWIGGWIGGVLGVVSTLVTIGVLWLIRSRRRH